MPRAVFRSLKVIVQPKGKVALTKLKGQAAVKSGVVHHLHLHIGLAVHAGYTGLALGLHVSRCRDDTQVELGPEGPATFIGVTG